MEWGKLFASLPDDPRVQAADDAEMGAFGLLVQSMCYCTSAESDGFIPSTQIPRFGGAKLKARAGALVQVGLWVATERGYLLDPDIWNEDKNLSDSADRKRAKDRERIAAKRAASRASQNGHAVARLSRDSRATEPATCSSDSRYVEKRREELPPPTPPTAPKLTLVPGEPSSGEGEDFDQERETLIAEVRKIRPDWSTRSIRRALKLEPVAERPWPLVRAAALEVARDPESKHPGRLAHDGPWWQRRPPEQSGPQRPDCDRCSNRRRTEDPMTGKDTGRCPDCNPAPARESA